MVILDTWLADRRAQLRCTPTESETRRASPRAKGVRCGAQRLHKPNKNSSTRNIEIVKTQHCVQGQKHLAVSLVEHPVHSLDSFGPSIVIATLCYDSRDQQLATALSMRGENPSESRWDVNIHPIERTEVDTCRRMSKLGIWDPHN